MDKHHKPCNGFRNSNAWHIHQEMKNMDILYYKAKACKKSETSLEKASDKFMSFLKERKKSKTASGVLYSKTNVKLAMRRF